MVKVATALTACGIETTWNYNRFFHIHPSLQQHLPLAVLKRHLIRDNKALLHLVVATALTACGIETVCCSISRRSSVGVATALTACGIETGGSDLDKDAFGLCLLQQYLPLAVLKLPLYICL